MDWAKWESRNAPSGVRPPIQRPFPGPQPALGACLYSLRSPVPGRHAARGDPLHPAGRRVPSLVPPPPFARMPDARPLTPFEHLLLRDRRPGYPMCFYLHCEVEGPLDVERLRRALHDAAARHPLLCSRVRDSWWRPAWRPPDVRPELHAVAFGAGADTGPSPWRPIDPTRTSGVRMVAIETAPAVWQVVLVVHHSVCDGLAGLEFLGDVWSHYHGSAPAPFRTPSRVVRRTATTAEPNPVPRAEEEREGLATETARFAGFVPAALARGPAGVDRPPRASPLPFRPLWLDRERTAALKERAAVAGVSVNDLVVAAVMRVAIGWNETAGRPARRVRVTMPASLKPAGTRAPAGIDMGYAFLDRDAAECADGEALARSIAAASRWIQEHRAAEKFLDTLALVDRIPPAMRLVTRVPLPLSTAVVSYVGNVGPRMKISADRDGGCDMPGGLRIRAMSGVPPIRPGTRLAVGVVIYDGRLCLTTLCDTPALGGAAEEILSAAIHDEVTGRPTPPAVLDGDDCRDRTGAGGETSP